MRESAENPKIPFLKPIFRRFRRKTSSVREISGIPPLRFLPKTDCEIFTGMIK